MVAKLNAVAFASLLVHLGVDVVVVTGATTV